jgi:ABC-type transport system involved in multi-copper enzyme maturation permease subunit
MDKEHVIHEVGIFSHVVNTYGYKCVDLIQVEGMTLQFSISVLVIYFLVFNLLSWSIFMKRDVAA